MTHSTNKEKYISVVDKFAIKATKFIGSTQSIIVHTCIFLLCFIAILLGAGFDRVMLVLTTLVSLEAIYLSIFIQMSVNRQARKLRAVSKDIEEIQADVEEISEDVEEIQKDVEEIQEDVEEIGEDVEHIEKDVDELQKDVEDIGEEVEEWSEDDEAEEKKEARERKSDLARLNRIEESLEMLLEEIKIQRATSKERNLAKDMQKTKKK